MYCGIVALWYWVVLWSQDFLHMWRIYKLTQKMVNKVAIFFSFLKKKIKMINVYINCLVWVLEIAHPPTPLMVGKSKLGCQWILLADMVEAGSQARWRNRRIGRDRSRRWYLEDRSRRGYLEDRANPPHVYEAGAKVLAGGQEECHHWNPEQ